jgi:hypothetical protein
MIAAMSAPEIERRVLRNAFIAFALASTGFWLVNGLSAAEEWRRAGEAGGWIRALMLEGTSNIVIFALFFPVALLERRLPAVPGLWRAALPAHLVGSLAFSILHVLGMWTLRAGLWPVLFERSYGVGDVMGEFVYEYRKDLLTYALILALLAVMRAREDALQSAAAAKFDARRDHVVTLRSGGRELRLPASDILSASAAGNYVEVRTAAGAHLARTTLASLEALLREAGVDPVRLHRSHLAARSALREILPKADGDADARLSDGSVLPVSRRYRASV